MALALLFNMRFDFDIVCLPMLPAACSTETTCRDPGSNQGPSDLQSDALPTELSRLVNIKSVFLGHTFHVNTLHLMHCAPTHSTAFGLILFSDVMLSFVLQSELLENDTLSTLLHSVQLIRCE